MLYVWASVNNIIRNKEGITTCSFTSFLSACFVNSLLGIFAFKVEILYVIILYSLVKENNSEMKKALVLAGGFPQIALIRELCNRNIETILIDWNKEPVAKVYANKFYQVSTLDVDAVTEIATKEQVDYVVTACTDQALLTVALVSEKLGLPCYIDYETALKVTNKEYMKNMFQLNDIPTSKHCVLYSLDEEKVQNLQYPLIVKPVDCNSSKGVRKAKSFSELKCYFDEAVKMSRSKKVIVEEFVEGFELSADIYVENGKAQLLSLTNSQKIADEDKFIIFRAVYPPILDESIYETVRKIAQSIADVFHIQNSPMLIQMISNGKDVSVVEFSARTGGGIKYLLIKNICGFDVIKAIVDLTLGEKPHVLLKEPCAKYIVNDFIYCKPGVFDHLEGFEELKEDKIIKDYYVFKWKYAQMSGVSNSGDRIAAYTIVADQLDELKNKHEQIRKRIRVIDSNGNDITRHDLITDLSINRKL